MMAPEWNPAPTPPKRRRGVFVMTTIVLVALVIGGVGGYYFSQSHGNIRTVLSAINSKRQQLAKTFSLPGHKVPALAKAKDTGALAQDRQLQLSVSLPLRNQAALKALIQGQYDPQSSLYHQFLTPQQFNDPATGYSPSPQTVKEVADYLVASGLQYDANKQPPSRQFINVTGSVAAVESAFHVQLHEYTVNGQTYYGPVSDPSVSSSLAGLVQHVSGLDNYSVYHSAAQLMPQASGAGYTAADLQKAYGADTLQSQGIDGSGQSIAFLELADYQDSDVSAYQQNNNLPVGPTPQRIQVDGGVDAKSAAGAAEVELDMEVAYAMAPKISELVYEGPNSGQGINDVYSQIVNDNKAKVVSISWGLCEESTGSAELQTLDQIFQQGAAEGIAFFAAAGDNGAYDCGDSNLSVDSPADDPNVTGVGGTSLTLNNGAYGSEKAWSCTSAQCTKQAQNGSGGGGGVSQQFSTPSFQSNLNPPDANGGNGRFVPDVAADADPNTGYAVYCTVSQAGCSSQGDIVVGGTSAAAPLWASGMALVNESLTQNGKQPVGNANASLYNVASSGAYHDVTGGDNLFYKAGQGYDLATGLGSANFGALAQALTNGVVSPPPPTTGTPTPGSPTATTTGGNPPPTTGGGAELLSNNGFENGESPWAQSSAGQYQLIDTENPHHGSYNADLCGYDNCDDVVAQAFVVPDNAASVSLSYYWEMVTKESGNSCNDHFTVAIYSVQDNGDGTISLDQQVATAQSACNSDANNGYQKQTVDLTSKLSGQGGQTLALVFHTTSDSGNPTRVFVDDVSLTSR